MKKIFVALIITLPFVSCVEAEQTNRISKESYIANLLRIKAQGNDQEDNQTQISQLDDKEQDTPLQSSNSQEQSDESKQNQQASTEFVTGSEDIPLFQGLTQTEDDEFNLGFDSESGSIASSSYTNPTSDNDVKSFYLKTLPQMGWILSNQNDEHLIFKRENKTVDISFLNKEGQDLVRFFISSKL